MASSGSSGSLEDVLLCPVCCEQIKTPKIIPCGHSFCLDPCLRDLLKTSHACPLCRQDIQAPPSGIADDFPTNFVVQALVSTVVTGATQESQSPPSDTSDDSKMACKLHQRQGTYFCGSCVKILCDECNESHEDGHEIEELNTISERRIGELKPLMGEIANSLRIIRERMESVKDAKVKCEESCQQVESEICDAVSSFTNLLQEEGKKLVVGAVKGREEGIKALNKLEVQLGDAEVAAKRMQGLATSLMTKIRRNDMRDTGMFDVLMTQQKKMKKKLANTRGPPDETVSVKFHPNAWFSIPLGWVNVVSEAGSQPNQPSVFVTSTSEVCLASPRVASSSSLFIQSTDTQSTGLFGTTHGGGGPLEAPQTGTSIKFQALDAQDTILENGTTQPVNTRYQVISAMEQYKNKSIEELRIEDHTCNQEVGSNTSILAIGMTPQDHRTTGGFFGQATIPTVFSFGTQSKPLFDGTTAERSDSEEEEED